MLGFLDWIVSFFETLLLLVTNLIDSLLTLLSVLVQAITLPPILIGFVPGIIGASISAVVAIGVAKLLLGWGNT